jgi:hypothetical protein
MPRKAYMRFVRTLVPSLAVVALCAGEATAPVSLQVADGSQLVKAWDSSIYAKVWADPSAAPLRAKWAEGIKMAQDELGFDPVALVQAMQGFEVRFIGMTAPEKPSIHLRVDLGADAAKVFALASKDAAGAAKQVAGADEAFGSGDATIARFKNVIVVAVNCEPSPAAPAAAPPAALAVDLDAKRVVDAIASSIPEDKKAEFDKIIKNVAPYLGIWKYRGDIVPEGVRERLEANVMAPGTMAVDRSVLARLPANTLMALSYGFDGKAYWKVGGEALLVQLDEAMHPGVSAGPEQTAQEIQGFLQAMGVEASLQQVVEGLSGTSLIALTQSAPFPALTIAVPRSKPMDQLIDLALKQLATVMPDEGQSAPIMIPDLPIPVPITLLRDKAHWVLSTDPVLSASWTTGAPGGFADTAMAKTLYEKAPKDAALLGASDTPAVLRTIQGYLGMVLAANQELTPEQKQAINGAIIRLAGAASTGYVFTANDAKGSRSEVRGLIGSGLVPVLVGGATFGFVMRERMAMGMADMNVEEKGDDTPEGKAIESLGSVLFPAQFQFQGGTYVDQDGDGIGEYGTLAELTGAVAPPGRAQGEATAEGFAADGSRDGYRFVVYLPDAAGKALVVGKEGRKADKAVADAQERSFVIYAWPADAAISSRAFAVDQSGVVYEAPYTGKEPVWNDLYGGQGWDGVPAWQPAQR